MDVGLTALHRKKLNFSRKSRKSIGPGRVLWINDPSNNTDMRFGLWNVKSMYRAGSLITLSRELSRYRLDLAGVQEVRWEGGGT
jgi:hypothetical protein